MLKEVEDMLDCSMDHALIIMLHYKFNVETMQQEWFEMNDKALTQKRIELGLDYDKQNLEK
jgi:hypothetical protein